VIVESRYMLQSPMAHNRGVGPRRRLRTSAAPSSAFLMEALTPMRRLVRRVGEAGEPYLPAARL